MAIPYDGLLDITRGPGMFSRSMAALTLGVLVSSDDDQDLRQRVVARLKELAADYANEENEMPATFACIGLSFTGEVPSSKFEDLPHPLQEAAVIIEALQGSTRTEDDVLKALAAAEGNVIFGGTVAAGLHALDSPPPSGQNRVDLALQGAKLLEFTDSEASALIARALRHRADSDVEETRHSIASRCKWGVEYQVRVAAVLAMALLVAHSPDRVATLQQFVDLLGEGDFVRMGVFAAYGLLALAEDSPISHEIFEKRPYRTGKLETYYHYIGILLVFTFMSFRGDEDFRAWCLEQLDEMQAKMDSAAETKFAYLICEGILVSIREDPANTFRRILQERYARQFDSTGSDDPTFFPQCGAMLGTAMAIFTARAIPAFLGGGARPDSPLWGPTGLPADLEEHLDPVLEKGLRVGMEEVQCAAMMALLAMRADLEVFRKLLYLFAMYEISVGDVPYFKTVIPILGTYGLLFGPLL